MGNATEGKGVVCSVIKINDELFAVMIKFAFFVIPPDLLNGLSLGTGKSSTLIIVLFSKIILIELVLYFNYL